MTPTPNRTMTATTTTTSPPTGAALSPATARRGARLARAAGAALLAALALSAGCDRSDAKDAPSPGRAPAAAAASSGPATLDSRSQYDLARALSEVERGRDRAAAATSYQKIRTAWMGRRYRWRVRVLEPLCRSRDACNVLPFDRGGRDKAIVYGWMPHLVLDDTGFAAIQRACAGKSSCQVDVEGELTAFVLDTENPTSLELSKVRVL
ncbi:MAG TPA: hypothetical protein VK698_25715 [Kofleriaceae bacterium]|nr:hypothetical protein [Kofleriaceae bacterium]